MHWARRQSTDETHLSGVGGYFSHTLYSPSQRLLSYVSSVPTGFALGEAGGQLGSSARGKAKALLPLHNVLTVPHLQHLQEKYFIYPNMGHRRDIGCLQQPASAAFWGGQLQRQRRISVSMSIKSSTSGLQPQEQLFVTNIGALRVD